MLHYVDIRHLYYFFVNMPVDSSKVQDFVEDLEAGPCVVHCSQFFLVLVSETDIRASCRQPIMELNMCLLFFKVTVPLTLTIITDTNQLMPSRCDYLFLFTF